MMLRITTLDEVQAAGMLSAIGRLVPMDMCVLAGS